MYELWRRRVVAGGGSALESRTNFMSLFVLTIECQVCSWTESFPPPVWQKVPGGSDDHADRQAAAQISRNQLQRYVF